MEHTSPTRVTFNQLQPYFNTLRPPISVLNKDIDTNIIFQEGKHKTRQIFYQNEYSLANEIVINEKIKDKLEKLKLPKWWRKGDTLRFAYASNMDPKLTIRMIEKHQNFLKKVMTREIEQITLGFIANGNLYAYGKNRSHESTLVLSLKSKIKSSELDEFMDLTQTVIMLMRIKACVPTYHERFSIILDLDNNACSQSFTKSFLKELGKLLEEQFPFTISNFYFFGLIDKVKQKYKKELGIFRERLGSMLKFVEFDKSKGYQHFEVDILEQKYGGDIKNLEDYWPPRCVEDATQTLDENSFQAYGIVPFTYEEEEFLTYNNPTQIPSSISDKNKKFVLTRASYQNLDSGAKLYDEDDSTSPSMYTVSKFGGRRQSRFNSLMYNKLKTTTLDELSKMRSPPTKNNITTKTGIEEEISLPDSSDLDSRTRSMKNNEMAKNMKKPKRLGLPKAELPQQESGGFMSRMFKMMGCCTDRFTKK